VRSARSERSERSNQTGLVAQHHRQLIGNEFPRFGPCESRHLRFWCSSGLFGDPGIGIPDRHLGQPSLGSSNLPAGISHRVPTGGFVVVFFPCHAFIVAATTDSFRTYGRKVRMCPSSR
jgi:hypothetical protein